MPDKTRAAGVLRARTTPRVLRAPSRRHCRATPARLRAGILALSRRRRSATPAAMEGEGWADGGAPGLGAELAIMKLRADEYQEKLSRSLSSLEWVIGCMNYACALEEEGVKQVQSAAWRKAELMEHVGSLLQNNVTGVVEETRYQDRAEAVEERMVLTQRPMSMHQQPSGHDGESHEEGIAPATPMVT